jgi:hypothetical protein
VKKGSNEGVTVPLRVYWYNTVFEDGDKTLSSRQTTIFDWDTAAVKMLSDLSGCGIPKMYHAGVRDILGTVTVDGSKVSNTKVKVSKVTPEEFCKALYDPGNADLLQNLRGVLGIRESYPFTADCGLTFDQAKLQQAKRLNNQEKNLKVRCFKRSNDGIIPAEDDIVFADAEEQSDDVT